MRAVKYLAVSGAIILITLIITNPSYSKFKNFSNEIPVKGVYVLTKQTFNGLVYSVYIKQVAHTWNDYGKERIGNTETISYCGIVLNFFEISRSVNTTDHFYN